MKNSRVSEVTKRGFSLVEVVIAVGITGFALLALVALLPHGIKTMRDAGNIAAEARISKALSGEVQLSEWEEIEDFNNTFRYYDNQSIEIEKGDADFNARHIYTAKIEVPPADIKLPGGTEVEENLRRVVIHVTDVDTGSEGETAFFNDEKRQKRNIRTYATIVTKMNK